MDKVIISLKKEDPFEVINKGELVEISPETNECRKCKTRLSPYLVGVCIDEHEEYNPENEDVIYNFSVGDYCYSIDNNLEEEELVETVTVQIAGMALVKTTGIVCMGDLLVSSENGVAEAVRYKHDWNNLGKIMGRVMQMTENPDECIALLIQT